MTLLLILVLVVAVAAIGAALWVSLQQRRTAQLRAGFGPEYDRARHRALIRRRLQTGDHIVDWQ